MAAYPNLEGQVAVVTGGAGGDSGLGLTATEALLRAGARVSVWDPNTAAAKRASEDLAAQGLEALFLPVDVTDAKAVADAYDEVKAKLGPVDTLLNNAAVKMEFLLGPKSSRPEGTLPFWQLDAQRFLRLLQVNVLGAFHTASAIAPDMVARGKGSIINVVTSPHTQRSPKHIPYGPSKAALQAMTQAMAAQLKGSGVRANAVLPGGSANRRGETKAHMSPSDCMVAPILWLACERSKDTSGEVFTGTEFRLENHV